MGEIKFRAWDVKEKQMLEVNHLFNLDNEQPIEVWTNYYEGGYRFNPDKSEIMQYTGLDDVNGKPIYENDILKVTSDDGAFYVATVKWFGDDGYPAFDLEGVPAAAWCYDSNALATILESSIETCEVIGNIFENMELLEVTDDEQ